MNMRDINLAYKIRHVLNAGLDEMPEHLTKRLETARQVAVKRKKKETGIWVLAADYAFAGGGVFSKAFWMGRMGLSIAALTVMVGVMGFYHYEEQRRIQDIAEIDIAMLVDELPPSAYSDNGFQAYLERFGA